MYLPIEFVPEFKVQRLEGHLISIPSQAGILHDLPNYVLRRKDECLDPVRGGWFQPLDVTHPGVANPESED